MGAIESGLFAVAVVCTIVITACICFGPFVYAILFGHSIVLLIISILWAVFYWGAICSPL